jgi:N-acetylglucosamine-6-phosphate deacetylase
MVTVAPEVEGAIDFIEKLSERGIVMAIGHHQANRATLEAAIKAGAKVCTHLGNGSHAQMHRLDNYIWEQLAEDRLWASFIPDGHHVPPSALRCMLRAKGLDRSLLVTDATRCAGMPPGDYEFVGMEVTLHPDGRLCLTGTPYFAGAALKMPDGIGVVVKHAGLDMPDALDLVVDRPMRLMGDLSGEERLAVGQPADLIIFEWNENEAEMSVVITLLGDHFCEVST